MAHTEEKQRILKLFEKGLEVGDIENETSVNKRTLYRWYAEYKQAELSKFSLSNLDNLDSQDKPETNKDNEDVSGNFDNEDIFSNSNNEDIFTNSDDWDNEDDLNDDTDKELIENKENLPAIDKNNWVSYGLIKSYKACKQNAEIREKLSKILLNKLEDKDLNYRAITCLSNAIACHSRIEREYGFYNILNPNVAIKVLEDAGYVIHNPANEQLTMEAVEV
jgi:hypothetical protein